MTTESIIKIYKAEAYYLPIATTPPELVAELEDEFTYSFYKESACARCPYLEDRPSENCDACESFLGQRATGGRKTIKEKHFLKVPRGGLKKLTNVLRHLGMNDRAKWFDRMPKEHSMSCRLKLASDVKLRDYQIPAISELVSASEGVLKAPPRSGKCQRGDALVLHRDGLLTLEELTKKYNPLAFKKKGEVYTEHIAKVATAEGPEDTAFLYSKVVSKTVKVKLYSMPELEGTPHHRVKALDEAANVVWKRLADLKVGDVVIGSSTKQWPFGSTSLLCTEKEFFQNRASSKQERHFKPAIKKLTPELARLLGYLVADASMGGSQITFTSSDTRKLEDYTRCLRSVFPTLVPRNRYEYGKVPSIVFSSTLVKEWFYVACGFSDLLECASKDKQVPRIIRQAPKELVLQFLNAYLSCDSEITSHHVGLCSASSTLINQLTTILSHFGIQPSSIDSYESKASNGHNIMRTYHSVYYSNIEGAKLLQLVGPLKKNHVALNLVSDQRKLPAVYKTVLAKLFSRSRTEHAKTVWTLADGSEIIKNVDTLHSGIKKKRKFLSTSLNYIHKNSLAKTNLDFAELIDPDLAEKLRFALRDDIIFSAVTEVEHRKVPIRVYDLEVPNGHEYLANGIVNHNTMISAAIICQLNQKTLILASQNEWLFQFRETFIGSETVKAMTTCKPQQIGFPKTLEDFDKYDICLCTLSKFKSANGKKLLEQIKDKFPVVVIDEVHYVPADGCARVIANLNARYIFGLTGSPERKNTAEYQIVEDLVGPIIHEVKMDRARPHVELLPMPSGKKNEFQIKGHGPYAFTTLVSKLEASTVRKIAICDKAIQLAKSGHMVLIPLTRVNSILEYTRYINEKVDRPKYALPFYGKIKKEDRMKVIDAARNYKCKILVGNIALLSVGLNIPRASAIIECGINSNSPACKQRLARVLTPMDDKPTPLFVFTLDECDIMRKCRRTEWWNTITPTFKPVVNSETKKTLNAYFAASSSSVKAKKGIYAHINLNEEL